MIIELASVLSVHLRGYFPEFMDIVHTGFFKKGTIGRVHLIQAR